MLLIEYVGHICYRSSTDGHLGRHLEYFKMFNDARVASVGFIKCNASTTRINKEKNFKIKFKVILVFYRTIVVYRFYCMALSHSQTRRHNMINLCHLNFFLIKLLLNYETAIGNLNGCVYVYMYTPSHWINMG